MEMLKDCSIILLVALGICMYILYRKLINKGNDNRTISQFVRSKEIYIAILLEFFLIIKFIIKYF